MDKVRDKLIKLLENDDCPLLYVLGENVGTLADYLIANGVTIPVRCKDCKYYAEQKRRCDHPNLDFDVECYDHWLDMNPDDFCSYGERRDDGKS